MLDFSLTVLPAPSLDIPLTLSYRCLVFVIQLKQCTLLMPRCLDVRSELM